MGQQCMTMTRTPTYNKDNEEYQDSMCKLTSKLHAEWKQAKDAGLEVSSTFRLEVSYNDERLKVSTSYIF